MTHSDIRIQQVTHWRVITYTLRCVGQAPKSGLRKIRLLAAQSFGTQGLCAASHLDSQQLMASTQGCGNSLAKPAAAARHIGRASSSNLANAIAMLH
jgi:hypothetical protein